MRFSVIVPLYNKAPYVEKALRSVLGQTFTDFELVVVDDGSKDGSAEIAERLLAGPKSAGIPFRLIRQANAGVSTARNNGVAASQGEYVCFLDADDWWDVSFLEKMDELIREYPQAGLYCTNFYYVHKGKNMVKLDIPAGYINYCREYARSMCMIASSSSSCMRRAIFDELGGFKPILKLGEDFDLWVRVALKYGTAFTNTPLAYFNNDLPASHRATHHLHKPEHHMLWNLDYLEAEEKTNPDFKRLMDNLRVRGLQGHFLSHEYHEAAKEQLAKVDWSRQPKKWQQYYRLPLWYLRTKRRFLTLCVSIKQRIMLLKGLAIECFIIL